MTCARFSPDGKSLVTTSTDCTARWVWAVTPRTGEMTQASRPANCYRLMSVSGSDWPRAVMPASVTLVSSDGRTKLLERGELRQAGVRDRSAAEPKRFEMDQFRQVGQTGVGERV